MKREEVQKQWSKWRDQREFHLVHGEAEDRTKEEKKAYREVIGMLEGNILRKNADKEANKGKPGEAQLGKTFANEMESNVCPICLELMIPPTNKPMLLFPCGHTFCNVCLAQNEKATRQKKCSLCKKVYSHSAVNIALQNLICLFTDNRQLITQDSDAGNPKPSLDNDESQARVFYRQKLDQLDMRLSLLRSSMQDARISVSELHGKIESTEAAEKILMREKIECEDELARAQARLEFVAEQVDEFRAKKDRLVDRYGEEREKLEVLKETVDGLNDERVKVAILLNASE
jgi:RING-type zinc-finger